jgi:hypothetical protein
MVSEHQNSHEYLRSIFCFYISKIQSILYASTNFKKKKLRKKNHVPKTPHHRSLIFRKLITDQLRIQISAHPSFPITICARTRRLNFWKVLQISSRATVPPSSGSSVSSHQFKYQLHRINKSSINL